MNGPDVNDKDSDFDTVMGFLLALAIVVVIICLIAFLIPWAFNVMGYFFELGEKLSRDFIRHLPHLK